MKKKRKKSIKIRVKTALRGQEMEGNLNPHAVGNGITITAITIIATITLDPTITTAAITITATITKTITIIKTIITITTEIIPLRKAGWWMKMRREDQPHVPKAHQSVVETTEIKIKNLQRKIKVDLPDQCPNPNHQ